MIDMQPKNILLFIVSVLLALLLMTLFSSYYTTPQGTVREGIAIGGKMLRYPTVDILFRQEEKENHKVDELIKDTKTIVKEEDVVTVADTITAPPDSLDTNAMGKIYYPGNRIDYIRDFKKRLRKGICQIVHYGDSQLEGDRITAYVRNRLQMAYSGGGPGFVPIKVVYGQNSLDITTSPQWERYAFFDRKQRKGVAHNKYGLFATYSRFTPYYALPVDTTKVKFTTASFTVKPSVKSYARLRNYTKFALYYGNTTTPVDIRVYQDGVLIREDALIADGQAHAYRLNFTTTPQELKVEFLTRVSPDFYGITLDAAAGVRMDNVAMRGEAGRIFTRMNYPNIRQMSVERPVDIFIFQYGGNTIPYMRTEHQLREYVQGLLYNMKYLKKANPTAMLMLIGPGDMTTSQNGKLVTYPMLPKLNEIMKEQCLENGIAYFSLYEAMGGTNSMEAWVKKGMAASDYVHFTPKGTQLISEVFYQCLHNDLNAVE